MEKATLGFRIVYKIWQILKCFARTFHRAQTLKLGGVTNNSNNSYLVHILDENFFVSQIFFN